MVSVLAQSVVDHGFEPGSGQTKDYEIGICCLSAKDAALRRKSKEEKRFKYAGYNLTLIIYNNLLKLYWKINDYMVNSDNIN
jgi:hypothetical protein